jgi:ADP-heptose:LPS heptosyltransferase
MTRRILASRRDNNGDVLQMGPAIRALAAGADRVTLLCGPRGVDAARLLPGVDEVIVHRAAWIDPEPPPLTRQTVLALVQRIALLQVDQALIFTSFHQSPLPLALVLRMAGVATVAAISEDYPGSLLDLRHRVAPGLHEVERALSLVEALGYRLPQGDDGGLRVKASAATIPLVLGRYVVVHPGASVPARAWSVERHAALVHALTRRGRRVVVTGSSDEVELTARVAGPSHPLVQDAGGQLDLSELGAVIAGADAIVVGNTGPAHLAAAVGTPVVSLFSPVVPAAGWHPWQVPYRLLGDQRAPCAMTRARACPVEGHPCLNSVTVDEVIGALEDLIALARPAHSLAASS